MLVDSPQVTQGEFRDFMEEACAGHTRDATIKECYALILANKFRATKIRPDDLNTAIGTNPRLRYLLQRYVHGCVRLCKAVYGRLRLYKAV